jgi:hypothetical protein
MGNEEYAGEFIIGWHIPMDRKRHGRVGDARSGVMLLKNRAYGLCPAAPASLQTEFQSFQLQSQLLRWITKQITSGMVEL